MGGVRQWETERMGPMCLEAIRAIHQPPERFRISPNRYPSLAAFAGAMRAGRIYVLSGGCSIEFQGVLWEFRAGDFADLPEGEYEFRALGYGPVELVSVWELPSTFQGGETGV